jgi:hypothetical protein
VKPTSFPISLRCFQSEYQPPSDFILRIKMGIILSGENAVHEFLLLVVFCLYETRGRDFRIEIFYNA